MPSVRNLTSRLGPGAASVLTQGDPLTLIPGQKISAGRHGDLTIGVEPEDTGISRVAVTISIDDSGWVVTSANANGVVICPWGQPARWAEPHRETGIRWPLLGLRLVGTQTELGHWVLLENPDFSIEARRQARSGTGHHTVVSQPPTPLTGPQQDAVQTVFAQHLAWPPVAGPTAATLQASASRLGISQAAVYQRLESARGRAYQHGSPHQIGVSDPEYIYVLVREGYLTVPTPEHLEAT